VELLLVISIIGIIASLAIPSLRRSTIAANEANAIAYMRTWTAAQELYRTRMGVYADADDQLFALGQYNL
jgi:type II secretory pathway pseudopilin PulG